MQKAQKALRDGAGAIAGVTGLLLAVWLIGGNFSYREMRWTTGLYLVTTVYIFYEQNKDKP